LPSGQNKKLRLYGPWRGQDDSGTRTSALEFERCFNVDIVGEEIVTRNGRFPFVTDGPGRGTAIFERNGAYVVATRTDAGVPGLYEVTHANAWVQKALPSGTPNADDYSITHWGNALILTGGYGPPLVYDNGAVSVLASVPGLDSGIASAYLKALPAAKWAAKYHGRLFLVTQGGTVVYSEPNNSLNIIPTDGSAPQYGANLWNARSNFDAKASSTDVAMGAAVYGDYLVLPTRDALFVYDELQLRKVPGAPGCVAPRSIAETPRGLVYLSADGVRLFTGGEAPRISLQIEETLKGVAQFNFAGAVGVHYPSRHEYRLYLPIVGSAKNQFCVVWKYEENRWLVYGGTPYWMDPVSTFKAMEVSAAYVVNAGGTDEMLVTADYDGDLWIEDRGITDDGSPIYSAAVFRRLGHGEDSDVRVWRNVMLEARATGAPLKIAMLADGEDFVSSYGSQEYLLVGVPGVKTLIANQSTWKENSANVLAVGLPAQLVNSIARAPGSDVGPVSMWKNWIYPHARVSRTMQAVVYCDSADADGIRCGGRLAIRGLELQFRPRSGRRAA
jgi:hypothetical protein